MEYVDILHPPTFEKSGDTLPIEEAWARGAWIGTFNLWVVQREPVPSILYHQRSFSSSWEPGKLDLSAGGHYRAGERREDGLREAWEELGLRLSFDEVTYLGRRINVSLDQEGRHRNNVVEVCAVVRDEPLSSYRLQDKEVECLVACPIEELLKAHADPGHTFEVEGIQPDGSPIYLEVGWDSFPYNWDNYHHKMTLLAQRLLAGEAHLLY